jgi:SAM-dependent methyltransferase
MSTGAQLKRLLSGGWPDDARVRVQLSAIGRLIGARPFTGACLNAGAGEGLYAPFLETFPGITSISHIDLVRPSISLARKDLRHRDFAGSLTQLPFADEQFDCCLCTEVLEHIPDDDLAIGELARVLKPNGMLLATVPTPPAPFDPAHAREGYTLSDFSSTLRRHGFTVEAHAVCFHLFMRLLLPIWRWQYVHLGRSRKSVMPRVLVLAFGLLDRIFPIGRPWDLLVLATRAGAGPAAHAAATGGDARP